MAVIFKLACFAWIGDQSLKKEKNSEQSPQVKQGAGGSNTSPWRPSKGMLKIKHKAKTQKLDL